jgi:hypothetical protein
VARLCNTTTGLDEERLVLTTNPNVNRWWLHMQYTTKNVPYPALHHGLSC